MRDPLGPLRFVAQRHGIAIAAALFLVPIAACGGSHSPVADGGQACVSNQIVETAGNRRMDVLFVIDDSPGMAGMHDKLVRAFPSFITAFVGVPGGYPNLHVAVVSSSMGAGRFANVPGCQVGSAGARDGAFRHPAGSGLAAGETFMRFNGSPINFQGDPGVVFSALADVGIEGCTYPQPLAAARRALARAQDPSDPDNGGFLRPDAELLVVIVTNQDDCSVPPDADLFDPAQLSLAAPYGGTGTYRCAEFGLLCDGMKPPHALGDAIPDVALAACVPAEAGLLTPVADLTNELRGLKGNPDDVAVSVIGGPSEPVIVGRQAVELGTGVTEDQPRLQPSCSGSSGDSASPSVRLKAWADGFGPNGLFLPACVDDDKLVIALGAHLARVTSGYRAICIEGQPVSTEAGLPNCQVTQTSVEADGTQVEWQLPHCDADRTVLPCWKLDANSLQCLGGEPALTVCRDASCTDDPYAAPPGSVTVRCQVGC